jgi:hypothetical protein
MNDDDAEQSERMARDRLAMLRQEHADLDAAIEAVALLPVPDMLLIGRLKRKKLAAKDEITRLEDQLTPDIIA